MREMCRGKVEKKSIPLLIKKGDSMNKVNTHQLSFFAGILLGALIGILFINTLSADSSAFGLGTQYNPMYVKIVK